MAVKHTPKLDAREAKAGDLETFHNLGKGDEVTFFEWPVEPLTVVGREQDENVGEKVRVKSEGDESYLYEVDGSLWHYVAEEKNSEESNPFPVQSLRQIDSEGV